MADINQAYGNIFNDSNINIRKIAHFFTQRKITESQDTINPKNLERTNKNINFTQNYLALVLPKDEKSPKLRIEIFGNNGYSYQGEVISFTENSPHFLIPLNNDKEMFVHIYDYVNDYIYENEYNNEFDNENDNNNKIQKNSKKKQSKYISFIHVPKRYQITEVDNNNFSTVSDVKNKEKLNKVQTQSLKVNI